MPMSPRLLRPIASGVHPEAAAWRSAVVANGGSVSASTMKAVSDFCAAIDAAGIRDRFYRLNLFCGSDLNACLVPLYRGPSRAGTQYGNTTDTNSGTFVASDYIETGASGGLTGGTTKYLSTGVDLLFSSQTDIHLSAYESVVATGNDKALIGADTSASVSPRSIYALYHLNASATTYYNGTTASTSYNATRVPGFWIGSNQSTRTDLFFNGSSVSSTGAKIGVGTSATQTYRVFGFQSGASVTGIHNGRLAGYSLGLGLSAVQAADYNTAMQAFQATLNRQAL